MPSFKLSDFDLPPCIIDKYNEAGLTTVFPWQTECLQLPGVLDGHNLVYSAPTSAGKSLVAEVLLAKRLLKTGKKAIFILPFVSLAREKMFSMKRMFEVSGLRVDGYMGGISPSGGFGSVDIAVCTIEKANGLINRLINDKQINKLGMLVVDEIHMVGDEHRGYLIELLLTKIRFMKEMHGSSHSSTNDFSIQIIGMSATVPNLHLLASWLDAKCYETDFRPVPLKKMVKIGSEIFDEDFNKIRDCKPIVSFQGDEDGVTMCCLETINSGHSVLIFCPTKAWCETLAKSIAFHLYQMNRSPSSHKVALDFSNIRDILEQLNRSPAGLDDILKTTVQYGVAYHHAGLTTEERDIIEGGFRANVIRVLVATSTLSSGVNLPARRVIIRSPTFHRTLLDVRSYHQMAGRAGRKGMDDSGESILICKPSEKNKGKKLVSSQLPPVKSCMVSNSSSQSEISAAMKRAILEIIVNGIASAYSDVQSYMKCTLLSAQIDCEKCSLQSKRRKSLASPPYSGDDVITECIDWLEANEFVYLQKKSEDNINSSIITATKLGRAALMSSLPTYEALRVLADLQAASKAFALDTELHLVYQVTPIFSFNGPVNWFNYLNLYENLSPAHRRVGGLVGVEERFLTMAATGGVRVSGRLSEARQRQVNIHTRFYASLILHDLVQEVPLSTICQKFDSNRGMIQSLQQSAASFAGMVTAFCQELGWWSLEILLREFQSRLIFGVQRELLDLTRISLLTNERARALYDAGLTSCELLAQAEPNTVELVLRNSNKFTSKRSDGRDEETVQQIYLRCIRVPGSNAALTEQEAALMVVEEAKAIFNLDSSAKDLPIPSQNAKNTDRSLQYTSLAGSNSGKVINQPIVKMTSSKVVLSESDNSDPLCDVSSKTSSSLLGEIEVKESAGNQSLKSNAPTSKCTSVLEEISVNSADNIDSEDLFSCCNQDAENQRELNTKSTVLVTESSLTESQMAAVLNEDFSVINSQKMDLAQKRLSNSKTTKNHLLSTTLQKNESVNRLSLTTSSGLPNALTSSTPIPRPVENASRSFSFSKSSTPSLKRRHPSGSWNVAESDSLMNELFNSRNNFSDDMFNAVSNDGKKVSTKLETPNAPSVNWSSESAFRCQIEEEDKENTSEDSRRIPPFSRYGENGDFSSEANLSSSMIGRNRQLFSASSSFSVENDRSFPIIDLETAVESPRNFKVVEIPAKSTTVKKFLLECSKQKEFSFSFCHHATMPKNKKTLCSDNNDYTTCDGSNLLIYGLAIYLGKSQVYYVHLKEEPIVKHQHSAPQTNNDQEKACSNYVKDFFQNLNESCTVTSLYLKKQIKLLFTYFGVSSEAAQFQDPDLAIWMLGPSDERWCTDPMDLTNQYIPEMFQPLKELLESSSRDSASNVSARGVQSCVEAVASFHLMNNLKEKLRSLDMWCQFCDVEMPHFIRLTELELNGLVIDTKQLDKERDRLHFLCEQLQQMAWKSIGRKFNLSSCSELSKILFCELGLKPINSSPEKAQLLKRSSKTSRTTKMNWSTKKEVLENLAQQPNPHPLIKIIMDWRSANYLLKKVVLPICMSLMTSDHSSLRRYHQVTSLTATGRVCMNLQFISKPTTITISKHEQHSDNLEAHLFSLRNVVTSSGRGTVLLAADYSQIELRLMAHLSGEGNLLNFLNEGGDVFRAMAAEMYGKVDSPNTVTTEERSQMKEVFYGLLYGMGVKRLGKRLNMSEDNAETFTSLLMKSYPKLQMYLRRIVVQCREKGYIVTISGRRRYLPDVNSRNPHLRSQAERQAVNSTVQGSAADLVKAATCKIDQEMKKRNWTTVRSPSASSDTTSTRHCYFVHQIHDELMYELDDQLVSEFVVIVRGCMVSALPLKVKLKVNIKTGSTWGSLQEFDD